MYAKVFAQIFDSSIADNYVLRHFFMDMLVLADQNGVVDMTPTAIAARTRIPIECVQKHLAELEAPDPESRTPEHDGRRIAKLDEHRSWGWLIINYDKFRDIATEHQRREKTAERVRKYRKRKACNAPVTLCNAAVTPLYASASESASVQDGGVGEKNLSRPSWMMAKKWLADTVKNGADYKEAECRSAWLALDAGGWQWGRRAIADWRSALERQIQTDRERNNHGRTNGKISRENPRNVGVIVGPTDYGKAKPRLQRQREAEQAALDRGATPEEAKVAGQMAVAIKDASANSSP